MKTSKKVLPTQQNFNGSDEEGRWKQNEFDTDGMKDGSMEFPDDQSLTIKSQKKKLKAFQRKVISARNSV